MGIVTAIITGSLVTVDRWLAVAASKDNAAMFDLFYKASVDGGKDVRLDPAWQAHAAQLERRERAIGRMGYLVARLPSWAVVSRERELFRVPCPRCHDLVTLGEQRSHACACA